MIKVLLFDLSRTLLFPIDKSYKGKLNSLHAKLSKDPNYNFNEHFILNMELLEYLKHQKSKYELCIFTSGFIQNSPAIKPLLDSIFSKIYSAEEMGVTKKDPITYKIISSRLKVMPAEIFYVDDFLEYVEIAKNAGLNSILYNTNQEVIDRITSLA